ncbi:MAG: DUF1566 domain-containing protein [Polyangiaceae bacterium]
MRTPAFGLLRVALLGVSLACVLVAGGCQAIVGIEAKEFDPTAPPDSTVSGDDPARPASYDVEHPLLADDVYERPLWPIPVDPITADRFVVYKGLGTAVDTKTGLEWLRTPSADMGWDDARAWCKNLRLGGHTDWRTPTRVELWSIVDFVSKTTLSGAAPILAPPSLTTIADARIWTSTRAWDSEGGERSIPVSMVTFTGGMEASSGFESAKAGTVCVRSAQAPDRFPQFTVDHDVVLDRFAKVAWQREAPHERMTATAATTYCKRLVLGSRGNFRLPTLKELVGVLDPTRHDPALDTAIFAVAAKPVTDGGTSSSSPPNQFFSSTLSATSPDSTARGVDVDDARLITVSLSASSTYGVRCVRDEP